jgi:hypothetical protein
MTRLDRIVPFGEILDEACMEHLKRIIEHPIVNIFISVVLIVSSLAEGWEGFSYDLGEFDMGVHHGVLLLGLTMLVRGIVEALESLIRVHERRHPPS